MQKALLRFFSLAAALILFCLPRAGYADTAQELHLYLGIPFDAVTPAAVGQALLDSFGEVTPGEYGDYLVDDFGYAFRMTVSFHDDLKSAYRIFLGSAENGWGTDDEFPALIRRDILQFLDMEAQLTARWGGPDIRYFYTDTTRYGLNGFTRFMFPGGVWDAEQMMRVCEEDRYLVAFSQWGNATLRLWADWKNEKKFGYLTKLDLYFDNELPDTQPPDIVAYPPANIE